MKFPTIYYYLNMRFKAEDLEKYTSEINKIMENYISAREKYSVNNTIIINSLEKMSERSMYFLGNFS